MALFRRLLDRAVSGVAGSAEVLVLPLALLLFLLASFVAINGRAFGRKSQAPAEVSAGPAA